MISLSFNVSRSSILSTTKIKSIFSHLFISFCQWAQCALFPNIMRIIETHIMWTNDSFRNTSNIKFQIFRITPGTQSENSGYWHSVVVAAWAKSFPTICLSILKSSTRSQWPIYCFKSCIGQSYAMVIHDLGKRQALVTNKFHKSISTCNLVGLFCIQHIWANHPTYYYLYLHKEIHAFQFKNVATTNLMIHLNRSSKKILKVWISKLEKCL